ncbi:MAG TPA: FtsX-like permease family protein [Thermoanaerobaculia bacterium]|jgi:putative ABC transport system permease protein|nr:FtsX-like permease family protein [Thermoanaerobaculia bacterium]
MEFGPIFRSLLRNRARVVLIVAEVALTLAIVANCLSLILDTRAKLARPSGFDDEHIAVLQANPFDDHLRQQTVLDSLVDQDRRALRAVPGVRAVSHTSLRPWQRSGSLTAMRVPGTRGEPVHTQICSVDPGIFETLGVSIAEGRGFTEAEYDHGVAAPPTEVQPVVVSRALADRFYPSGGAVGKQIGDADESQRYLIVGIVDHYYNPFGNTDERVVFQPARSVAFDRGSQYLVRTEGDPGRLLPQLEKALLGTEKGRLVQARTLVDDRTELHGPDRILVASLNSVMALLVLVTALGIVGLTSFSVGERRKQIGTRRALGADRAAIVRHFLLENWMVTSLGIVLGVGLAYALNFGIVTWVAGARLSPAVVAAGAVGLWIIGIGAALGPALRGAQVAPAIATRNV